MQDSPNTKQPIEDEITIKDIILKLQYWRSVIWPKKNIIIALSLFVGVLSALYTQFIKPPVYFASYQLFFEEKTGGMSSAMRLASSFGFSLGAGGGTSTVAVQEYLTSRDNIAKAMKTTSEKGSLAQRYYERDLERDENFAQEFSDLVRISDTLIPLCRKSR